MSRLLIFIFLIPFLSIGQINESDSLNLKASVSLTGLYQSGNVETVIFRAKSELGFTPWKNLVFKTTNSYVYQEFEKDKADEDILSLNFLYINPQKKVYPLLLGFVSSNFRREIDLRTLFGAGVSFQLYNKEKNWLKASLTTEYEQTSFKLNDFNIDVYDGNSDIDTWRGTIWINGKYYLFKGKLILNHESFYQPSLQESNNYRWRADFGLELPVWKFLNFKINYLYTSESIVIAGQKKDDEFLTFGLTLKNYK